MGSILKTYARLAQQIPVAAVSDGRFDGTAEKLNIILTGSTGVVGTHLLRASLDRDSVGHVFFLNSGDDGGDAAHRERFDSTGLAKSGLDDRVTFVKADMQQPSLSLDSTTNELLHRHVGFVIHAAWPICVHSSIAAVEGHKISPPPEEVLDNLDTPAPFGYGRTKFLAEIMVETAARHLGKAMPATIIRVGQVAGPVRRRGLWNPKEWLPSMVVSSLHWGKVPDTLGPRFNSIDFNPAAKLFDFFSKSRTAETDGSDFRAAARLHPMAIDRAPANSPALRSLEPVGLEWMGKWVQEWIDMQ
ncbi:putative Non-canonical non-ribosomal peptide synthetase FUB8 [Seiridium unicorne]|uniref:Non-canonical non-ribosomal peptide synthetase FUB8 n=1 Tax=Seiridium unicorne TaxID=138068 RepID=A0ABR2US60_9PEZI